MCLSCLPELHLLFIKNQRLKKRDNRMPKNAPNAAPRKQVRCLIKSAEKNKWLFNSKWNHCTKLFFFSSSFTFAKKFFLFPFQWRATLGLFISFPFIRSWTTAPPPSKKQNFFANPKLSFGCFCNSCKFSFESEFRTRPYLGLIRRRSLFQAVPSSERCT